MRRVLCFIDSLGAGGAQRQIVGLALFLKQKEYNVSVLVYHDEPFYSDMLLSGGVPVIYLRRAECNYTRPFHIMSFIKKINPDVVISYIETPCICACFARFFKRFRLIVSERNTTQETGKNERIRFNLFRKADFVVPNAYAQEAYIKRTFPFLSKKVVTIPNFVDLEHFVPPASYTRRKIPEVVVAASIWASKNTLGFIDAVAALRDKGYKFHISWYGLNNTWIDYINQCKQKIEAFALNDFIELKDKTTQIKEVYQNADFFCLPSFYEGTPNVICEAMACGLPVVCSDVCDNSRYVSSGENGFLFDPRDTNSVVLAFEQLFALSSENYKSFRLSSRRIAEQNLSKDVFINSYIKLIEQ